MHCYTNQAFCRLFQCPPPHWCSPANCINSIYMFICKKKNPSHWIPPPCGLKIAKFCRISSWISLKSCITPVTEKTTSFCFGAYPEIQLAINNKISCWVFVHRGQWFPDFSGVMLLWMNRRCRRYCVVDRTQVRELFPVCAVNHQPDAEIWLAF